jgi:hypothetical protein
MQEFVVPRSMPRILLISFGRKVRVLQGRRCAMGLERVATR